MVKAATIERKGEVQSDLIENLESQSDTVDSSQRDGSGHGQNMQSQTSDELARELSEQTFVIKELEQLKLIFKKSSAALNKKALELENSLLSTEDRSKKEQFTINELLQEKNNLTATLKSLSLETMDIRKSIDQIVNRVKLEEKKMQERKYRIIEKAKDEFSAMITHELKTPLTPIKGYCEMLLEKGVLGEINPKQSEAMMRIYQNADRLETLISDILDAQKLNLNKMKFKNEMFHVNALISDLYKQFGPYMIDKNIKLVNINESDSVISSDKDRITQVFYNLVKNAVDFVPEGEGLIEIGAKDEDDKVIFCVKDNGIGIAKDQQARVFKKFYQVYTTTTRKHGGSGLGLAICKDIVKKLGGRIWLESDACKGTAFYFMLPTGAKKSKRRT